MNWSIWAPGAFDYAADKLGLTYGVTAELNQKNWALRGGYVMMGAVSNSNNFDTQVFRRGQYVAELETRYTLFSRPGKLRTIGWVSSANSGSYYRKERILETYYAYAFTKQITLTADYQFVTNPAYNADRGPVHVFSGRLHGEF
jgi:hypothetical protein